MEMVCLGSEKMQVGSDQYLVNTPVGKLGFWLVEDEAEWPATTLVVDAEVVFINNRKIPRPCFAFATDGRSLDLLSADSAREELPPKARKEALRVIRPIISQWLVENQDKVQAEFRDEVHQALKCYPNEIEHLSQTLDDAAQSLMRVAPFTGRDGKSFVAMSRKLKDTAATVREAIKLLETAQYAPRVSA
jgi:hypothetical protein